MPASVSRAIIHGGVGRDGSTPRTTRATNSLAPTRPRIGFWSSTVIGNPLPGCTSSHSCAAGSRNAAPVACAYSRAMPRIDSA